MFRKFIPIVFLAVLAGCQSMSADKTGDAAQGKGGGQDTAKQPAAATSKPSAKEQVIMEACRAKYPNTTFVSIEDTQFAGLYEIRMPKNIAYSDETCRYWMFGHLFDMQTQTDLTAEKLGEPSGPGEPEEGGRESRARVEFNKLPFNDAIKTVKGKGTRRMAVFSDPDCPYCKRLENSLKEVNDVTIYTFLFPLEQLHPEAKDKSIGVWCAPNRAKAWSDLMTKGTVLKGRCSNPVDRNIDLAESFGITGTPALIFENNKIIPGAIPATRIEQELSAAKGKGSAPAGKPATAPKAPAAKPAAKK